VEVVSKGERSEVDSGGASAAIGSLNPQVVQNFAPERVEEPQFGQRSMIWTTSAVWPALKHES